MIEQQHSARSLRDASWFPECSQSGRHGVVTPQFIASGRDTIAHQPAIGGAVDHHEDNDDLRTSRGIGLAVELSLVFWVVLLFIVT